MRSYKGVINLEYNKYTSITNTKFISCYNKEKYAIYRTDDHSNRLILKNLTIDGLSTSSDDIYYDIRKNKKKNHVNLFKEINPLNEDRRAYLTNHQSLIKWTMIWISKKNDNTNNHIRKYNNPKKEDKDIIDLINDLFGPYKGLIKNGMKNTHKNIWKHLGPLI